MNATTEAGKKKKETKAFVPKRKHVDSRDTLIGFVRTWLLPKGGISHGEGNGPTFTLSGT
ncbi:MAG: hypothetical protein M4579_007160, partial [Chaenotheca gracillima]